MFCVLWFRELVRKRWPEKVHRVMSVPLWRGLARVCGPGSLAIYDRIFKILGN